jgi:hypothetical protein
MDLSKPMFSFKNKTDKEYLKLKHKAYKKIAKSMKRGLSHYTLYCPSGWSYELWGHTTMKLSRDFEKLGIKSIPNINKITFTWTHIL